MQERLEKIPIPFEDFEIKLSENSKILFSGIFGSGKTTFLNDFFTDNKSYLSIHIFPVNYSVASNRDIFELIKFDILLQLMGMIPKEDFENVEIPYHLTLWSYLAGSENLIEKADFFTSFLSFYGNYGRGLLKVYGHLKVLREKYIEFHSKFQKDDLDVVTTFLNKRSSEKGDIYEEDFFTELIRVLIEKLKANGSNGSSKKPFVLVVDDLDRLDPDHIFRLLNIFSAHIDFMGVENDNKFDFDKVILVCDYNNVQNVFNHRYGKLSDFNGYIDKFYSSIYWFSSSSLINKIIGKYLNSINVGVNYDFFSPNNKVGGHIRYVIEELIKYNLLNFRELIRFDENYDINSGRSKLAQTSFFNKSLLYRFNLNAVVIVDFILNVFNNTNACLAKIESAKLKEIRKGYENHDTDGRHKIVELLFFINHLKFDSDEFTKNAEANVKLEYEDYVFDCMPIRKDYDIAYECVNVFKSGVESNTEDVSYFAILEEAIKTYVDLIK